MEHPLRKASAMLSLLALVATTDCSPCEAPECSTKGTPSWEQAFSASGFGSVSGVWGSSPSDVYAVGGGEAGAIYHFDGTEWGRVEHPAVPLLVWVYGFGPDDVWAVGTRGGVLHFDGNEWSRLDPGLSDDLWGVFGHSPNDVWLVGGDVQLGPPVLLHFDGTGFTLEELASSENPLGARALFKVWGVGTKLFAVGQLGLILEHADGRWLRRPAGADADDDFVSLWGTSENNIIAVGGRANARIAHFDGVSWTTTAPTGIAGLNGVYLDNQGTVYIGGVYGTLGTYDIASGAVALDEVDTYFDLHAVWGDGSRTVYAVGGNFLAPYAGIALRRDLSP
ncbi:MAG: WD40/YVTN/BNR-like repeat-containing protein [Myxococcota bacterium]